MGDWSEELGMVLLKSLAAVAPVPRQEDFGVDAVATLLRYDKKCGCVYAEQSFYVQFKSESVEHLSYQGQELEWLRNLQLPFFVGQVRRRDSKLRLFAGHRLRQSFLRDFTELIVKLQDDGGVGLRFEGKLCEVSLGEPILSFDMEKACDDTFVDRVYQVMRDYLLLEQQNINARPVRFVRPIEWKTNRKAWSDSQAAFLPKASPKDDLYNACEYLVPGLQVISLYADAYDDRPLKKKLHSLKAHLSAILTTPEPLDETGIGYWEWGDPFAPGAPAED